MTSPTTPAFTAFLDDAAVFPPGLAPLDRAVREHVARRGTAAHPLTGPLILPLDAVAEAVPLAEAAGAGGADEPAIALSVVTPPGRLDEALRAADGTDALRLQGVELKTDPDAGPDALRQELTRVAAAAADGAPEVYVELAADQVAAGALEALEGTPVRLKFRTGGVTPELFPSTAQLADVLHAAVSRGIRLKLTAGLHQAVRFTHPATGFTHHGFLNIAAAVLRAQAGAPAADLVTVLESRDAEDLVRGLRSSDAWRDVFGSFGTCDIPEPVASLQALGLLPADLLEGYRQTLDAAAPAADRPTDKE